MSDATIKLPETFTFTAHTGCMGTKANSLDSIDCGYRSGAGIVEFDLNFNNDGEPVLSHDKPKGGEVTLEEAFKKISEYEKLKVNVDVKSDLHLEIVKPLAEKCGIVDRIFFTGIHDGFVESARKTGVMYYLNVKVGKPLFGRKKYYMSLVQKVKEAGAIGINFNKKNATDELVRIFHENGLLVSIWTVDKAKDMNRIIRLSPDNITTRNPDVLSGIIHKSGK